jgi:hypothetical protein
VELGERGIRVNSISPGMTVTGAFGKYAGMAPDQADEHPEIAEAAIRTVLPQYQPLHRLIRTDDIAQAALFLGSDASRMVTGQDLVVDGGSPPSAHIASSSFAPCRQRSDRPLKGPAERFAHHLWAGRNRRSPSPVACAHRALSRLLNAGN